MVEISELRRKLERLDFLEKKFEQMERRIEEQQNRIEQLESILNCRNREVHADGGDLLEDFKEEDKKKYCTTSFLLDAGMLEDNHLHRIKVKRNSLLDRRE